MHYICDKNHNIVDYKVCKMLDKWTENPTGCMRLPMPKDFNDECVFFHINVEYIQALAYDDKNMDWVMFTRDKFEKQEILDKIDQKQHKWYDEFHQLAMFILKNSSMQLTCEIACNIAVFSFEPHPVEIKFDRRYLNNCWVVSDKNAACMPCGIYPNNPVYDLNDMTDDLFEKHDKNEKHQQALTQLQWI